MSFLFSCSEENPNWKVADDGATVMFGSEVVADVYGTTGGCYPKETRRANACLIAEAPAMYRLLDSLYCVSGFDCPALREKSLERVVSEFKVIRERAECEYRTRCIGIGKRWKEKNNGNNIEGQD